MDEEKIDKEKINELCYDIFNKHYLGFEKDAQKCIDALQIDIETTIKSDLLRGVLFVNIAHMMMAPIVSMTMRAAKSEREQEDVLHAFNCRVRMLAKHEREEREEREEAKNDG